MNPIQDANTGEQALFQRSAAHRIPVNGSIEVSPLCNMDCAMCYVRLSRKELEAKGRLHSAEEWLSVARQMKDAGVLFLLLTGGEPLLYPGFKALYLGLRQMGFILTLNTNATLLDESWAEFFAANKPRRLNVTLYGIDDRAYRNLCHYPGGFDRTMHAIHLLKEHEIPFRLSYSLTKENAPDLDAFMDLSKRLELHCGIDPYMMPATRERTRPYDFSARLSPEDAARYAHEIHRRGYEDPEGFRQYCREKLSLLDAATRFAQEHPEAKQAQPSGCLGGRCSFSLNWQGELRPCVILTSPAVNVFEEGFAAGWQHVVQGMETLLLHEDCSVCPRRSLCDICPAAALYETGAHNGKPEYLCRYTKELVRLMREEMSRDDT